MRNSYLDRNDDKNGHAIREDASDLTVTGFFKIISLHLMFIFCIFLF